jgi:hypothetical protein
MLVERLVYMPRNKERSAPCVCLELRSKQPMLVERLVYMPRNKERSAPCVCLELRSD